MDPGYVNHFKIRNYLKLELEDGLKTIKKTL